MRCAVAHTRACIVDVDPRNIIYANPCKERAHIEFAKSIGVSAYTLDNRDELAKLVSIHKDARLLIRLLVDDTLSVMPFGTKFGANLQEAEALVDECKQLGANLVGFAFHVGSACQV
jgi:ornithine decarboxylase